MNDLYVFGVNKNQKNKFFISFRGLFNKQKISEFNLFSLKGEDKFLGIYYGYRKPIQNIVTKYQENGITKSYTFSKAYYMEFRFSKGSVSCYIKGMSRLIKKEKSETQYNQSLLELIIKLEREVYKFYNKKFPNGGIIKNGQKKTEIITIASIKGGVGKSVLAIIFGHILKNFDKKVLLIDLDPQNSLTSYFIEYIKGVEGINVYYMFKEYKNLDLNKYLNKINSEMYIIPSHPILCKFEQEDERYKEQLLEHCIKKILYNNDFDYIIIDTPPSLGPLLYNALNITDKVIIPIQIERWSVEAFPMLMDAIEEVNII